MKTIISLSSAALVLVSLVLGGCAAAEGEEETDANGETTTSSEVTVDVADKGVATNRLGAGQSGYKPAVKLADLKAAGARCSGTHCDYKGETWDCSGAGYCTNMSR